MIKRLGVTKNTADTLKCGQSFAKQLKGGEVIGLKGNLGAGKTVFVKGVAVGLGITASIQSPTFILRREYAVDSPGIKQLIHIDLYRLDKTNFKSLEFLEDVGSKQSVTFIEWPERISFKKIQGLKAVIDFEITGVESRLLRIKEI